MMGFRRHCPLEVQFSLSDSFQMATSSTRNTRRSSISTGMEEGTNFLSLGSILMIGFGSLLFLALFSYEAKDTPGWAPWSNTATTDPRHDSNLLGPVGTVIAGCHIFLLGGAAFFVPVGLVWFGISRVMMRLEVLWRPLIGFFMVLLSLSMFLAVQSMVMEDWSERYFILSAGGGIGFLVGQMAAGTIGIYAGAFLALVGVAFGLTLLSGMTPREAWLSLQQLANEWQANRMLRREQMAAEQLAEEKMSLEAQRQMLRNERLTRKVGKRRGTGDDVVIGRDEVVAALRPEQALTTPELPLQEPVAAEPEIIDGTVRKQETADPAERKMSLAEWRKQREQKNKGTNPSGMASALSPLSEAFRDYQLPDLDLLHWEDEAARPATDKSALLATQQTIIKTLESFKVGVNPGTITRGPSITRYEVYPTDGLRVKRISELEADLARATKAEFINILAPIPGKDTVGIEIANSDKVPVPLRELLEDPKFHKGKARIPLALGKDVYGETVIGDLASMPHLLVAGTTGSGKSVCINSVIASLLFQFTPDQLRFIMVDPKVVEMQVFNDLPHLIVPVVTDPKKVLAALKWCVNEMEHRYQIFAKEGVRNFEAFNNRKPKAPAAPAQPLKRSSKRKPAELGPELPLFDPPTPVEGALALTSPAPDLVTHQVHFGGADLDDDTDAPSVDEYYSEDDFAEEPEVDIVPDSVPYIVVIIDELADLMQTASADVENLIARLTQKARAAGIHLIVATQTPRANVITGVIKANIPSRIAFQVASGLDSRVILDTNGAEKLVGKGDMLYQPPGTSKLTRVQGAFITDEEIVALVEHCKAQGKPMYDASVQSSIAEAGDDEVMDTDELGAEDEDLLEKCIEVILQEKIASTSRLQRRLKLGYTRAARMMDILEKRGMIGPGDGAKPREILISPDDY
jgi:S-DNA-T family DNA segregation ATPase FtsK/SpoIIIE